jgi:hypothetical protein
MSIRSESCACDLRVSKHVFLLCSVGARREGLLFVNKKKQKTLPVLTEMVARPQAQLTKVFWLLFFKKVTAFLHFSKKIQTACKPGSVHALTDAGRPFLWDAPCSAPRATNPGDGSKTFPCVSAKHWPPLFGLAPGGVYPANLVTKAAVRFYRPVSPLPMASHRRFVFCGTIPGVAPAGR